ncbi:hypothetical protein V6N12_026299 [Hibiscus sabdariffa]|uniref:Uncharacterized protein n=1 Tax=Hibiscus sabdariffa TaxID=183260 RepID=A0ABR2DRU9_9ROSI
MFGPKLEGGLVDSVHVYQVQMARVSREVIVGSKSQQFIASAVAISCWWAFDQLLKIQSGETMSFGGSHFMMEPRGTHLTPRPTDWRTELDDRLGFELTGSTARNSETARRLQETNQSPGNDHITD